MDKPTLDGSSLPSQTQRELLALLDKIYPGPREAVEKAWGRPELVFCHFYDDPGNRGVISLLRAQDGGFAVAYLAFEQDASPLALDRLQPDLAPLLPREAHQELCFNLYGRNPRAIQHVQSLGFHLDSSGIKYQYPAGLPVAAAANGALPGGLHRRTYRPGDLGQYAGLLDSTYAWLQQQSGREVSAWADDPAALGRILQAAEETGSLLAFWLGDHLAGLCLTRGDGYIDNLAVHPDFQNRGFGRAILAQAVGGLRASGAARIHLDVAAVNVRAQRFYENCGWVECGCFADHTYFPVK